ncbi:hypothetical protein D3C72_349420 [compost metagenome]
MNGAAVNAGAGQGWRGVVCELARSQIADRAALHVIGNGGQNRNRWWGEVDDHRVAVRAGADVTLRIGRDYRKGVAAFAQRRGRGKAPAARTVGSGGANLGVAFENSDAAVGFRRA